MDVENSVTFDPRPECGATFRFPVTWSYLTEVPHQARPTPGSDHVNSNQATPLPSPPTSVKPTPAASAVPVLMPAQKPAQTLKSSEPRASGPEATWEMVIPKMARPNAARPPRALEQPARRVTQLSARPDTAGTEAAVMTPTEVSFYTGSEASFVPRRLKVVSLSVAVVVVGCVIALVRPGGEAESASGSAPTAAGTWSRRTAYVVGAKTPRDILVYSGSEDVKNYRIEFSWVPDTSGVGWIFRGTDSANYYAANLRLIQAGATPSISAEHFAVVKGVEGAHSRKVITLGRTRGQVLVRMDANGPAFTLYLQGSPADYWTDVRFEAGSLGFYGERGERPVLQALRFTFFRKSGLQTVVTSLQ